MTKVLQSNVQGLEAIKVDQQRTISDLEGKILSLQEDLKIAEAKLQTGETLRRKLHNMVQELKGNIRVFCRVRPLLSTEYSPKLEASDQLRHLEVCIDGDERDEIRLIQSSESASGTQISKPFPFSFDKIFDWNCSQKVVFEEISQLVQSALDGYRVCIFAYGQTGSGKTFTMEGDSMDHDKAGMIPRAVQQIFETTCLLKEKGWTFSMEASYLEIYNETLRDLLATKSEQELKYEIKHVEGRTFVTDQVVIPVTEPNQVMSLLRMAASNRAVAETQCNERSSRSHRCLVAL